MNCPKCRADNPDTQRFCGECGTQLGILDLKRVGVTQTLERQREEITTGTVFAGRYQVIEELGKGGMGKVYKVLDVKIKEKIALKLLRSEIAGNRECIERFSNELRLARKISHRNVCRMFDLGEDEGTYFITMEYVPGQDLKGLVRQSRQLATGTAIAIAKQVCEGLAEAHRLGVVHRDLKPSNIFIDQEGNARIMDFGIARTLQAKRVTGTGVMIGTPEYMSPEQVEGKDIDLRSDIYSLGTILYEMVTGQVPFEGDSPFTIGMKQKGEIARNPKDLNAQIPDAFSRMIMKCLEKDRAKRYQSADDALAELKKIEEGMTTDAWAPAPLKEKSDSALKFSWRKASVAAVVLIAVVATALFIASLKPGTFDSIAVLYFDSAAASAEIGELGDGITESLIYKLQDLPSLKKVIASSSVARYRGQDIDPKRVGADLGVAAILTGRIRKAGENLSINVELVNAQDGSLIWSRPYVKGAEDVIGLQEDILMGISEKLGINISKQEKERLAKRSTESFDAYQAYLKGRYYWDKRTKEGLLKGLEYFQAAIDADPGYALAYSGVADSYVLLGRYGFMAPHDAMPKGRAAALKAIAIDDSVGEAHNSLAFVLRYYDWDWAESMRAHKRAIELSPNYATAHHWYALLLSVIGRHEEAISRIKRAKELDPLSLIINTNVAWCLFFARRYDEAIVQFNKTLEMDPNYAVALSRLGDTYVQKRMYKEAISSFEKAVASSPHNTEILAHLGYAHGISGNREEAGKIMRRLLDDSAKFYVSEYDLALVFLGLGQKDDALDHLEQAYEKRASYLTLISVDPVLDALRSEPRFKSIISKLGVS